MSAPSAPGLVVVVSAKGGCGATSVATSLASASAAARGPDRVCLADFDFARGDVARALDLGDHDGVGALVRYLGSWDEELLRVAVPTHASGLRAVLQPYDLSALARLERAEVDGLLAELRRVFPLVVADCGTQLELPALTAAMEADRVVLVTHATVPAVRNAQRLLGLLDRIDVPLERVAVVVNAHRPGDLEVGNVERLLGHPLAAVLPFEPACAEVDTTGRPLSSVAPRSSLARAQDRLAVDLGLVPGRAEPAPRRLFGWGRP